MRHSVSTFSGLRLALPARRPVLRWVELWDLAPKLGRPPIVRRRPFQREHFVSPTKRFRPTRLVRPANLRLPGGANPEQSVQPVAAPEQLLRRQGLPGV